MISNTNTSYHYLTSATLSKDSFAGIVHFPRGFYDILFRKMYRDCYSNTYWR